MVAKKAKAKKIEGQKTPVLADGGKKLNRPGRPKKDEADKLEQFSIRLPPKLKLGLELLSRAQNRSLSQVIEWALQVGFNNYRVNSDYDTVAVLLDKVWQKEAEFDRLWAIYNSAPNLLSFDDRSACEVIDRCYEFEQANEYLGMKPFAKELPEEKRGEAMQAMQAERTAIFFQFVRKYWKLLKPGAVEHIAMGKSAEGVRLNQLVPTLGTFGHYDLFAQLQVFSGIGDEHPPGYDFAKELLLLDSSMPWSNNRGKHSIEEIEKMISKHKKEPTDISF